MLSHFNHPNLILKGHSNIYHRGEDMEAVKIMGDDLLVDIEVTPRSHHFGLAGYNAWRKTLEVKIKSPPIKGKANKEIIKEFSQLTGCPVELESGLKSQQKTIRIRGMSKKDFLKIVDSHCEAKSG
jgi:uncharacterized protein (TIGR00251 family)